MIAGLFAVSLPRTFSLSGHLLEKRQARPSKHEPAKSRCLFVKSDENRKHLPQNARA